MKKLFFLLALAASTSVLFAKGVTDMQLFPADFQRGNYPITENYPYRIVVKFKGEGWKLQKNQAKFILELPANISLLRASTRLVPRKNIPFTSEKISRDGKEITRYILDLPYNKINISPKSYIWRSGFDIYIEAGKGSVGQRWTMPLYFDVNGEKLCEKNVFLSVLPEIPFDRKALQKFRLCIKELPSAGNPDSSLLSRQLKMWKSFADKQFMALGWEQFNYPENTFKLLNENAEFFYWTHAGDHSTMILQNSGTDDLGFYVANKVVRPNVPLYHDAKGKINKGAICPQYLMKDPEEVFYGDYLRRAIEKAKKYFPTLKSFIIDYEPIAGGGTCQECMKDFAKFAKLKSVPELKDIQQGKALRRNWQLYKIHQNKIIMAKIADGVKKHFPDMKFSFCATELRPSADVINTWDAVDVGAMESKTDFYSFMIYSTGLTYYNYLAYAAENLTTAKSFPWIDPSEEVERFFVRYTPEKVQQNIVASIALNADGLMIYPSDTLDGRYMTMFADTSNILAQVEDIYYGKNLSKEVKCTVLNTAKINIVDEKGILKIAEYPDLNSQIKTHLHEKEGVYLLSILNYADEKAVVQIAIPTYKGGNVTASDLINKRNYTGVAAENIRNGFAVEIPANGSAVIKLGEKPCEFAEISQQKLIDAGKDIAESGKKLPLNTINNGNAAVQWRIFKKNVMITLINGENYVTVNPRSNGRIEEWCVGQDIPTGRPSGTLGEVIFYDPSQSEKREYSIEKTDLAGAEPALILKSEIHADTNAGGSANPLAGLIMEKRIALKLDGTVIITDTFINPTAKDMQLGFRIKHMPFSSYKAGTVMEILLGGKTILPEIYLKKGAELNWYAAAKAKELDSDTRFTLKAGRNNFNFDFEKAVGLYFWRNQVCHTAEALYAPAVLKAGEKYSVTEKISFSAKAIR